jgi:hypothetical protein
VIVERCAQTVEILWVTPFLMRPLQLALWPLRLVGPVWLTLGARRFYRSSWPVTFFKLALVVALYSVSVGTSLIGAIFASMLLS